MENKALFAPHIGESTPDWMVRIASIPGHDEIISECCTLLIDAAFPGIFSGVDNPSPWTALVREHSALAPSAGETPDQWAARLETDEKIQKAFCECVKRMMVVV